MLADGTDRRSGARAAPDAAAAAAGRKFAGARSWETLGRSDEALWGECQGSALYRVRVDCGCDHCL